GGQRCHTSDLKAAFATGEDAVPDPNASGGTTTSIVLTNKSSHTCKIGGFPVWTSGRTPAAPAGRSPAPPPSTARSPW
ncbi:DUF4232 domain-containing protein, partial [Streptomyces rimosus]|uniref:DUF4232 domain-containing protein n=1 Tax=Streptomyces rimosus TaxID=1927 RepID=UPI002D21A748